VSPLAVQFNEIMALSYIFQDCFFFIKLKTELVQNKRSGGGSRDEPGLFGRNVF